MPCIGLCTLQGGVGDRSPRPACGVHTQGVVPQQEPADASGETAVCPSAGFLPKGSPWAGSLLLTPTGCVHTHAPTGSGGRESSPNICASRCRHCTVGGDTGPSPVPLGIRSCWAEISVTGGGKDSFVSTSLRVDRAVSLSSELGHTGLTLKVNTLMQTASCPWRLAGLLSAASREGPTCRLTVRGPGAAEPSWHLNLAPTCSLSLHSSCEPHGPGDPAFPGGQRHSASVTCPQERPWVRGACGAAPGRNTMLHPCSREHAPCGPGGGERAPPTPDTRLCPRHSDRPRP